MTACCSLWSRRLPAGPTIRLLARADVLGIRLDLTASGADALARMLLSAAADGVAQLDQDDGGPWV